MSEKKRSGEAVEFLFTYECMNRSMLTSTPDSDCSTFDRIVEFKGKLKKVQIKSTDQPLKNYKASVRFQFGTNNHDSKPYTKTDCDFIACFIKSIRRWYIFPIEVAMKSSLSVYPDKEHKLNIYKEAWELLKSD